MNKALILAGTLALTSSVALAVDEHHPPEQAAPAKQVPDAGPPPPGGTRGPMDAKMMERCKAMHEADRERLDRIERRLEAIQGLLERQAKARPKR